MATPKTLISEIFYHRTSAMRFELGSYRDTTKFKIEIVPQLKDQAGNPVEKRFDYDKKLSMVFGFGEILKIKRFVENTLNPKKQVPQEGYVIEHFFEAGTPPEKKKSALIIKRAENKFKADPKSPYNFQFTVFATLYSSMKATSISFGLTEEESYWIINMMPKFAWAFMEENARIVAENREIKAAGGNPKQDQTGRSPYRTSSPGAEAAVDQGEVVSKSPSDGFDDIAFDDIPF